MERLTFHHLDRDWEVTVPDGHGDRRPVRFRLAADHDPHTYEGWVEAEELEDPDRRERELALRRALESALVLQALAGHEAGLTAEEVARATGMPPDAAEDRMKVLDSVQPVIRSGAPQRYRTFDGGD